MSWISACHAPLGFAIEVYVIMDHDDAREMVSYLVQTYLEDVLAHHQAEGHVQELISPFVGLNAVRYEIFSSRCAL